MNEAGASKYTGISVSSLQKMRGAGTDPAFAKIGSRVRDRIEDLDKYPAARVVMSTSAVL